jgi:hypothetical protein
VLAVLAFIEYDMGGFRVFCKFQRAKYLDNVLEIYRTLTIGRIIRCAPMKTALLLPIRETV